MAEISLNASMRSNLLSLQQTQKLQDSTQSRLSTGLKVNSAIDNPSSFYTASSLNNRAEDLGALLDAMTQSIQTIKAATQALETGTAILQQAKATAVKASETSVDIVAKVNNEAELLAAVEKGGPGYIVITSDIHLTNEVKLKDGQKLVGDNYFAEYNGANRKLSFDYIGKTGHGIVLGDNSLVSNLDIDYNTDQNYAFNVISSYNAKDVTISNININTNAPNNTSRESPLIYFISSSGKLEGDININSNVNYTGFGIQAESSKLDINGNLNIKTSGKNSYGVYTSSSILNIDSASNVNIETTGSDAIGLLTYNMATTNIYGKLNIKTQQTTAMTNGKDIGKRAGCTTNIYASAQLYLETGGTNSIFLNGRHNTDMSANILFIQSGAKIAGKDHLGTFFSQAKTDIRQVNDSQTAAQNLKSDYFSNTADFSPTAPWTPFDFATMIFDETFTGTAQSDNKKPHDSSYKEILSQYDQLIKDASYKGVNLLESNNLKVNFNEERSSGLEVKGGMLPAKPWGLMPKAGKPKWMC